MTNAELFSLQQALYGVSDLKGEKFAYAVVKNRNKLEAHIKKLTEMTDPTPEFNKFDKERLELAKKHAKLDEGGEPIVVEEDGRKSYDIKDMKAFEDEMKKLRKKHDGTLADREIAMKKFQKKLEEETDFELHMVDEEYVPSDITANQLAGIECIIKRKNESVKREE